MSSLELLNYVDVSQKHASIPGVEMFGIINKQGRMIDFWGKEPSISENRKDIFLMQTVLQCTMQRDYCEEFGTMESCTIRHENAKIIHFPLAADKTVLIIADKKARDHAIIGRVRRLLSPPKSKAGGAIV